MVSIRWLVTALLLVQQSLAENFTTSNGQIFTPGFVVLNAPQPNTPLGGDVTANGKLELPPHDDDDPSQIFNITMFLYSYTTGRNFTISNGTATANNASLGEIMAQESGSTVKHINWVWPDCLVGDGAPDDDDSDRGTYNISIRQNFRLNGEDHYTIFDVPISVTNSIEDDDNRPSCDSLTNELLSPGEIDAETANEIGVLFAPGDATEVETETETEARAPPQHSLNSPEPDMSTGAGSLAAEGLGEVALKRLVVCRMKVPPSTTVTKSLPTPDFYDPRTNSTGR
ncbi:hypothetical protein G7Z17_g12404 [Cylindrodendrum hubeiense]|uniref:Uncharacterized protein n=1 Tax=Cylindrodendrum hubeiense TaxID=595255 RepID=A0A9P5H348_9HYPO|nr:hypothetical protein G7Z17_g12404 [Cylindrodendrum hubeiense]